MKYAAWIPTRKALATASRRVIVGTEDEIRAFFPHWVPVPFESISLHAAYPDQYAEVMRGATPVDQAREGLSRAEAPGLQQAEVGQDQQCRPDARRPFQDEPQSGRDQA